MKGRVAEVGQCNRLESDGRESGPWVRVPPLPVIN